MHGQPTKSLFQIPLSKLGGHIAAAGEVLDFFLQHDPYDSHASAARREGSPSWMICRGTMKHAMCGTYRQGVRHKGVQVRCGARQK